MKLKLSIVAALVAILSQANAATYVISNVVTGDTNDVLFENFDGTALNGGIVALGYFATTAPSSSLVDIQTTIANFTLQTSALTGTFSEDLEGSFAGYVQAGSFSGDSIISPSALIGQSMYMFVGNASTLESSTAWALAAVKTIQSDVPFNQTYNANPNGSTILGDIGTFDTFTGDVGLGAGTYNTLKLAQAIPEPSAALLGAIGAMAILRRRRN
jgi:hypothetical protein